MTDGGCLGPHLTSSVQESVKKGRMDVGGNIALINGKAIQFHDILFRGTTFAKKLVASTLPRSKIS
jgi:hypothetical protein